MVLRRPYAFLIKHFRLIHLIIAGILGILVFQNRRVYVFLRKCIEDSVNKYDALRYINYSIYIFIFLAMVLCGVIYWLLKFKDKPRKIYIFTIVSYVIIGIFMFIVFAYLGNLPNEVIEQKTIRLYRDIMLITLLLQYVFVVIMLIRGLGFNIKKFNFDKDLQELSITEADADEVEVNVNIDTTNVVRSVRKQKREFGYYYQEFKIYILIILGIIVIFGGYKGYSYFKDRYKVYSEGDTVGLINYISVTKKK